MIAADRFPIDQSERPFNGSRPDFPFRLSILPSSPEFSFFANRFAYREKKEKKKGFFPSSGLIKVLRRRRVTVMYILLTLKTKLSI